MYKTKIICELGINHNGSYETAKKLIDIASINNCWGIKFQYRSLKKKNLSDEIGKEIINLEVKKNYLKPSSINLLTKYGKRKGLKVGISFFSRKDFYDFKNLKIFDFLKVPSSVSDNFDLLKYFFTKKKQVFISTGGKRSEEIIRLTNFLKRYNVKNYSIFHCISNYPLFNENAKLGFIDTLRKNNPKVKIGYSSHENNIYNCIYALSKKIDYIERHITLDKKNKGIDHTSSSDPNEISDLANFTNKLDLIDKKIKYRELNQGEVINIQNLGYSYYFNKEKKKNSILKKSDLYLDTPNVGVNPSNLTKFINKKILDHTKQGSPLISSLFSKTKLSKKHENFSKENLISFPIREKDYKSVSTNLRNNCFEFHFTFQDLKKFSLNKIEKKFLENNSFSIHLPDYIDQNNLIDFFSSNKVIRNKSLNILKKCIQIAKKLENKSKKNCNLIVSILNYQNLPKEEFYKKVKKLNDSIEYKHKINLLPQWLPAIAWYFGGSFYTNIFADPDDFKYLKKIKLKICMDISHLILSCNYYKKNPEKVFNENINLFHHFHIGDAKGYDFEGILLGEGEIKKTNILKNTFKIKNKIKVVETWQGHLNNCEYFKKDLNYLQKFIKYDKK
tara:strand:- start:240 stop:2090 length:1851 start_codon:yes stop_codon:yes gene_type:complete